jgi:hypothetical protein
VQLIRTSSHSSRYSASSRVGSMSPIPASSTAANRSAPWTDDSTTRRRVRSSERVATV